MSVNIFRSGRVVCEASICLPISAGAAWGQLRDLRTSALHDPFHTKVHIEGAIPQVGARLRLQHRYCLKHTTRVGTVLRWTERVGFAFSDLCQTNPGKAFPHVIAYRLTSLNDRSCELTLRVTGKWTAKTPRWIGRLWLRWVFSQMVSHARNDLLRFALSVKSKRTTGSSEY